MALLGQKLKDERIRQGKQLRAIADELRIGSRYLEAIESEDWKELPGGFFNRSFIRQYSQALGFDPAKIELEFSAILKSEPVVDLELLAAFLEDAPKDVRLAFEFRHESWLVDPVYELLSKHGVALCWAESEKLVVPERTTADFTYFRLRKESYSAEERAEIGRKVAGTLGAGKDTFVFFKHEDSPAGVLYAEELLKR